MVQLTKFQWAVAGLVVVSVAGNALLWNEWCRLQVENKELNTRLQDFEAVRQETEATGTLQDMRQELVVLRRMQEELPALRSIVSRARDTEAEVKRLRTQVETLQVQLQDSQRRLTDQGQSIQEQVARGVQQALDEDEALAQAVMCVNHMKQIGLAARMWAVDHNENLPPNFLTMREELVKPSILVCPSDAIKVSVEEWKDFNPAQVSYQFMTPNQNTEQNHPNTVMFLCPIHDHKTLMDGSVLRPQDGVLPPR